MNIYVIQNGAPTGPYELDLLRQEVQAGRISISDQAWAEGYSQWLKLSEMPEIMTALLPPIPQLPTSQTDTATAEAQQTANTPAAPKPKHGRAVWLPQSWFGRIALGMVVLVFLAWSSGNWDKLPAVAFAVWLIYLVIFVPVRNFVSRKSKSRFDWKGAWERKTTEVGRSDTPALDSSSINQAGWFQKLIRSPRARQIAVAAVCGSLLIAVTPALLRAVVQTSQAHNPVMREHTKQAWIALHRINQETTEYNWSESGSYRRLASIISQIDLDGVDPLLIEHLRSLVGTLDQCAQVVEEMENERQAAANKSRNVSDFLNFAGAIIGGMADNNRSPTENLQLGIMGGEVAGKIGATLVSGSADNEISQKYRSQLSALGGRFKALENERLMLRQKLEKKYGLPLM